MYHFVTYFDRNYPTRGLALLASLKHHCLEPYKIYVVCMDQLSMLVLNELKLDGVEVLHRSMVEAWDTKLIATMNNRTSREYLWTLTPAVILAVLRSKAEIDVLTYLDADQYFFSDASAVKHDLAEKSCLIHEHRFSPGLEDLVENGIYNVGVLAFRRDAESFSILNWWKERCIEWCYARPENGRMGDQGYLNDWPERFKGVHVTENYGIGVAPWNMQQYRYRDQGGCIYVDELPVVVFHFHDLKLLDPSVALLASNLRYQIPRSTISNFYQPYLAAIRQAYVDVRAVLPNFNLGCLPQLEVTQSHSLLAHSSLSSCLGSLEQFHPLEEIQPHWVLYPGSQAS